jgi:NAD(P)-dependent dehydrogenase (short-subunit alcohol dehydrogenase family)
VQHEAPGRDPEGYGEGLIARAADVTIAVQAMRARDPQARLSTVRLDLGALSSVRAAADKLNAAERLDGIVLNAGVLANGAHGATADRHEPMYGTNHLGHFALGALIYPALARTDGSLIVTMGSVAARSANLNLDDLESSHGTYRAFDIYKRSKLAQMIFAFELEPGPSVGQQCV